MRCTAASVRYLLAQRFKSVPWQPNKSSSNRSNLDDRSHFGKASSQLRKGSPLCLLQSAKLLLSFHQIGKPALVRLLPCFPLAILECLRSFIVAKRVGPPHCDRNRQQSVGIPVLKKWS